jgi:hypothetical protein
MKYLLFIISFFVLLSCATKKEVSNVSEKLVNESLIDSSKVISDLDTVVKLVDEVNEEKREVSEMIIGYDNLRGSTKQYQQKIVKTHQQKTNLKLIDKSTDLDTNRGWIAYSVPDQMQVAKTYSVKVRISKRTNKQNKAILILGDDDAINNEDYKSVAIIEDITVSGEMTAELRGDEDAFKIVALSTNTQSIDDVDYTEWEWIVNPKKSGKNPLKLVIKIKDLNKDIIVFNKNITIKKNVSVAVEGFFDKYWQWFMTTIIIPIFIYFWNRKKKRKQTKKS